jgi:hypothetical protein
VPFQVIKDIGCSEGVCAMIIEKYQDASAYGEEAMSSVRDYLHRGSDQMSHMVDDRPGAIIMMAGFIGFGVGLLLSQVFAPSEDSFDKSAERFGQNLLDRIEHAMPTILRERLMK